MKHLSTLLLVAALSPSIGFAVGAGGYNDLESLDYISWCEGDQVMSEDEDGQVVILFDCYDSGSGEGLRCEETATRKGDRNIISASCK